MSKIQSIVFTLVVLILFTAAAGIYYGEVDKVVRATGEVITTSPRIILQSLSRAIVTQIYVREGEVVSADTPLLSLDPTFVDADIDGLETKLGSLNAELARIQAELNDWAYLVAEGERNAHDRFQVEILTARHRKYDEEERTYANQLKVLDSEIRKASDLLGDLRKRVVVSEEIEAMYRELQGKEGSGSKLDLLKSRAETMRIREAISDAEHSLATNREKIEGILSERDLFRADWRNLLYEQHIKQQRERDQVFQELNKSRKEKQMVVLKAPTDAQVIEIGDVSAGSVVREATTLMTLVPLDSALEVEAKITIRDISYLAIGEPVIIKLDSLPYQKHGHYTGELTALNRSTLVEKDAEGNQVPYFLARIRIGDNQLRNIPDTFRLVPGMTVSAEIKVGTRPLYEYILYPILRGLDESVREPY